MQSGIGSDDWVGGKRWFKNDGTVFMNSYAKPPGWGEVRIPDESPALELLLRQTGVTRIYSCILNTQVRDLLSHQTYVVDNERDIDVFREYLSC